MSKREIKVLKSYAQQKIKAQIDKGRELVERGHKLIQSKYKLNQDTRERDNFETSYEQWVDFTYESLKQIFVSTGYAQDFEKKRSSKSDLVGSHWIPDVEYYLAKQLIPKMAYLGILLKSIDEFEETKTDEHDSTLRTPSITNSNDIDISRLTLQDFLKHQDIQKLSLSDIPKILNVNQSRAVAAFVISLLVGVFVFGYQAHSWKHDKAIYDLSEINRKQKSTIENLNVEIKALKDSTRQVSRFSWEGTWETETPVFRNVRINLIQSSTQVNGKYNYVSKGKVKVDGHIEAEVTGNVLIGNWTELVGKSKIAGLVYFVMSDDGQSFVGRYTSL